MINTDFKQYQDSAMRTRGVYQSPNDQMVAGCLGLAGESGEFLDLIKKKWYHQKSVDAQQMKKELGDVFWYIALICDSQDWNMEDIAIMNVVKLKVRYPEGFNFQDAAARRDLNKKSVNDAPEIDLA